ncbi:Ig-like domain-containing protein [Sphingomonas sp. GCM10030256]|uniref:Ig-like domain-containing protein n=1 Tax=Sphingomonas sp. GCM10030256 TaxID=3273427 RepID=UPI003610A473
MTKNKDGSPYRMEQILLHEIVHYLLDDNAGFVTGGQDYNLGGLVGAAGGAANQAYLRGEITKAELDYILAPYYQVTDGEQLTTDIANAFYNEIFEANGDVDYYLARRTGGGANSFDYNTAHPQTTPEEMERLKRLLVTKQDALTRKGVAYKHFKEVARRAAEKGLINADNLRFVDGIYNSYLRSARSSSRDLDQNLLREKFISDAEGVVVGVVLYKQAPDGTTTTVASTVLHFERDENGRIRRDSAGNLTGPTALTDYSNGLTSVSRLRPNTDDGGFQVVDVDIKIPGNEVHLDFSQAGGVIGSHLGRFLAKGDALTGVVASAALQTIGDNFGDILDGLVSRGSISASVNRAVSAAGSEFLENLTSAGIGAVSSYLTAELVNALGVEGFAAELAHTGLNSYVSAIITNLPQLASGAKTFQQVLGNVNVGNVLGSFLGTKLASELVTFDTVGGQLGSAIGSSLATLALGSAMSAASGAVAVTGVGSFFSAIGPLGLVGGPVGMAVAAFIGFIAGGLIGSVFGGTPRAGADVHWNDSTGQFEVANAYRKHGGSKKAAVGMAEAVAGTFNSVLAMTGGELISPELVQAGNYGMRKSDYVYRPFSTRDKDAITKRFAGKRGAEKLIGYGIYEGLTDPNFKIAGGDIYAKRALYNTFLIGGLDKNDFESGVLLGNLMTAQRYETYLANSTSINALIAAEPDSVFTAEWLVVLSRAVELGLTRRHESDWYGGFGHLLEQASVTAAQVEMGFDYDAYANQHSRLTALGPYLLGDVVDVLGQTLIDGTVNDDVIRLLEDRLLPVSETSNIGLTVDGQAFDGHSKTVDVAATIDAGGGHDVVYGSDRGDNLLGGAGNDTLIGGKLDDWLIGGEGNDRLFAGRVADGNVDANTALAVAGGSGNYLDGGAGDDTLYGSAGSDWLAGGDGIDVLEGGRGGDILNAGAGNEGTLRGGAGSDYYVFNRGDGQDTYFDESTPGAAPGVQGDSISAKLKARSRGQAAKVWHDDNEFLVDGSTRGGDDRISFGTEITLADLLIERGSAYDANGNKVATGDLIIKIQTNGVWGTGDDRIIVKDWFEGTRRIEWLDFANGEKIRISDFTSFVVGSDGADVLVGTNGHDFMYGGDGDDKLWGLDGQDVVAGGKGRDLVSGNDNSYASPEGMTLVGDIVLGGNDDDVALGGHGDDVVSGDLGNDQVYGGTGNDIVTGGLGDDIVVGGHGDDVFRYNRGDGRDTIIDEYAGTWEVVWQNGVWQNGYSVDAEGNVFKGGVQVGTRDWDGTWDYNEYGSFKTLQRLIEPATGPKVTNSGVDTLEFGVGIDPADLVFKREGDNLRIIVNAGAAAETGDELLLKEWFRPIADNPWTLRDIERFAFVSVGEVEVGAMALHGGTDGADEIVATGMRAAWITGGSGDDRLTGTAQDDILAGNGDADRLTGGGGSDVLFGGEGDDHLSGGAGAADQLIGGSGHDVASYSEVGGDHVLILDEAFAAQRTGEAAGDVYDSIEGIEGSQGNDRIYGDEFDNSFDGAQGNDVIHGGASDDLYIMKRGMGHDVFVDRLFSLEVNGSTVDAVIAAGDAGADTIELDSNLSLSDLNFVRTGSDLEIWIGGSDRATLKYFFEGPDGAIESLLLADGFAINLTAIRLPGTASSDGEDFMVGAAGAETLIAGAGNDVLSGGDGADTLQAGDGDDFLEGGAGADTLDGGADSASAGLEVGDGPYGDTVRYAASAASVTIDLATGTASGGDAAGDSLSNIENVVGSTVETSVGDRLFGNEVANRLFGLAGNDHLEGRGGHDVLVGGGGDDQLHGGAGDDNLSGDDGQNHLTGGDGDDLLDVGTRGQAFGEAGNDTITGGLEGSYLDGGTGNDEATGQAGNDELYGRAGADVLVGGTGDDILDGGEDNDHLDGGGGNDHLDGNHGNDTIIGGAGDDIVHDYQGNDTYVFDANSGTDRLIDQNGVNRLLFEGVTPEQIWLSRVGNDLRVQVIGGTSVVNVEGYFSGSNPTLVREISTGTHSIFLKNAADLNNPNSLLSAMSRASTLPGSTAELPADVTASATRYWWAGGKAKPVVAAELALSMSERAEPGANDSIVGVIQATDDDENLPGSSSYAVTGQAANGQVVFDPAAGPGTWRYTPNIYFNGADSFRFSVADADGHVVEQTVTVSVAAIDSRAQFSATQPELAVDENSAGGTVIGTLSGSDPEGASVSFSMADPNSPFEISSTGVLSVRAGVVLDAETASSQLVTLRVADGTTAGTERQFTVAVRNLNERPDAPVALSQTLHSEQIGTSHSWQSIATFQLADPDRTTPGLTIVGGNENGWFTTSESQLTFSWSNFTADWLRSTLGQHGQDPAFTRDSDGDGLLEVRVAQLRLAAQDAGGLSSEEVPFDIWIEDVNEAPTAISLAGGATTVERDNPAAGSYLGYVSLGTLSASDPDAIAGDTNHGYSVGDSRFVIHNGHELRLADGASLDYESAATDAQGRRYVDVPITVRDRFGNGLSLTQNVRMYITDQDDFHYGSPGQELNGAQGRDVMFGGDGDQALVAHQGNDELHGENGNDRLYGGEGDDRSFGDTGNDVIEDAGGDDYLDGGDGDDHLQGGAGKDILIGGAGADVLQGGADADDLDGGDGIDTLRGGEGNDSLRGGEGFDFLEGDEGIDTILGGFGNDHLSGGTGDDVLHGDDGDDRLVGGMGADELVGGMGIDTADYSGASRGVTVNLTEGVGAELGDDKVDRLREVENLVGSAYDDELTGDAGSNSIEGGAGVDKLHGGGGNDALLGQGGGDNLYGMDGDDVLRGGSGDDLLVGGAGDDRYLFVRGDGHDIVDQTGSTIGVDSDIVGFEDLVRDNLWFRWDGDDIVAGVLGQTGYDSTVRLLGFRTADADQRANIRVVIAGRDATIDLAIGELATAIGRYSAQLGYTPSTQTQFNELLANTTLKIDGLTFAQTWNNFWTGNKPPLIGFASDQIGALATGVDEDQHRDAPYALSFTLGDDYDSPAQLSEFWVRSVESSGSMTEKTGLLEVSAASPTINGGTGTINIRSVPNASGIGFVWVHAKDAGGLITDKWVQVTVRPVADAPIVLVSSPGGNAGAEIPIDIAPHLTDADGSETIVNIEISNVPDGFQFKNAAGSVTTGANYLGNGRWRFTPAQLTGLRLIAPPHWSQDLSGAAALQIQATSQDGGSNGPWSTSPAVPLNVTINGRPSNLVLEAQNFFAETFPGESHANRLVARFTVADPDGATPGLVILGGNDHGWFTTTGNHLAVAGANWTADWLRANKGQHGVDADFTYDNDGDGMKEIRVATLTLAARDAGGLQSDAFTYNVFIENVNEGPATPSGPGRVWFTETGLGGQPANAGVTVATYALSDPDGTTPQLELTSNPGNWFEVVGNTVRFRSGLNFDFEAFRSAGYGIYDLNNDGVAEAHVADVRVRAHDGQYGSAEFTTQVFISNVNEAPHAPQGPSRTWLDETGLGARPANAGTVVATYGLSDPDGTAPTLQFHHNPGGWFDIIGNEVRLRSGLHFDFEQMRAQGYGIYDLNGDGRLEAHVGDVWVYASDGRPDAPSSAVVTQVFISDVNERPNNAILEAQNFFPETFPGGWAHPGNLIARFGLSDPDGTTPGLVILGGNDHGWFTINGNHLAVAGANWTADWLRAYRGTHGVDSDFYYDNDGDGAKEIRVATLTMAAQDAASQRSDPFNYHVFIEDVNETPWLGAVDFTVPENAVGAGQTVVGQVYGWSGDFSPAFNALSYSWAGGSDKFLVSSNGEIRLSGALDYESATRHDVVVRVQDAAGAAMTQTIGINVTNANDNPTASQSFWSRSTNQEVRYVYVADQDGDPLSVTASADGYWMSPDSVGVVWDSTKGAYKITVLGSAGVAESYGGNATVTISDGRGGIAHVGFSYTMNGRPLRPGEQIPPIVLDLDGDGVEIVSLAKSTAKFDMDSDGLRDQTGWVGADDGLLVLDRNGDGQIASVDEISFVTDLNGAVSDLEGLAAFDTNANGTFDAGDMEFKSFQVWQDKNQDGVSAPDELKSLTETGIRSIDLELQETGATVEGATDNVLYATSEFIRANGSTGDVGDVFFAYKSATDLDGSGKLKKGKKIKHAGIDNDQPLHAKLKRKNNPAITHPTAMLAAQNSAGQDAIHEELAGMSNSSEAFLRNQVTGRDPVPGQTQADHLVQSDKKKHVPVMDHNLETTPAKHAPVMDHLSVDRLRTFEGSNSVAQVEDEIQATPFGESRPYQPQFQLSPDGIDEGSLRNRNATSQQQELGSAATQGARRKLGFREALREAVLRARARRDEKKGEQLTAARRRSEISGLTFGSPQLLGDADRSSRYALHRREIMNGPDAAKLDRLVSAMAQLQSGEGVAIDASTRLAQSDVATITITGSL